MREGGGIHFMLSSFRLFFNVYILLFHRSFNPEINSSNLTALFSLSPTLTLSFSLYLCIYLSINFIFLLLSLHLSISLLLPYYPSSTFFLTCVGYSLSLSLQFSSYSLSVFASCIISLFYFTTLIHYLIPLPLSQIKKPMK